jgi:phage terminase large subunit
MSEKPPERTPVNFPSKLNCLFERFRYKVLWGGRGGAKSWGIARALLIQGAWRKLRIMCAREIQKSISESVLKLLERQMADLGLQSRYRVNKTSIVGTNGTEFLFCGLQHNIASLKSVEGCDIVWVEEARASQGFVGSSDPDHPQEELRDLD